MATGLLLMGCGQTSAGPRTWLDRPLDGTRLPLNALGRAATIQAHASDGDGVAGFEFFVGDSLLATAPGGGGRLGEATALWTPASPGTYKISARAKDGRGNLGSEASSIVVVGETEAPAPPAESPVPLEEVQVSFTADRRSLEFGDCATLQWRVRGAERVLLDGDLVEPAGERRVCPEETTEYVLSAYVGEGPPAPPRTERELAIEVVISSEQAPPLDGPELEEEPRGEVQIVFVADRTHLGPGECAGLEWEVQGGHGVELDGAPVERSGGTTACPEETTTYWLTVDTGEATERRSVKITVERPEEPPEEPAEPTEASSGPTEPGCAGLPVIAFFSADPAAIVAGQSATLSWGPVTNGDSDVLARSVTIDQGLGEVGSPGSRVVHPNATTTYTMIAAGCGGTASRQVTVVVNPPSAPTAVDLAVTDLYPQTLHGPLYARITNRGPGSVDNATIQLSCQWVEIDPIEGTQQSHQIGPRSVTIASLSPGQTIEVDTGVPVNLEGFQYNVTCTIQVPFSDPNGGNNTYSEAFP